MPEDKGIWSGTYEIDFATRFAASVMPGTVAYDIAKWHGFFADVMAAQCARHVHVLEPLPVNAERISHLIALNLDRRITVNACAVIESEMDLIIMPETSMAKNEVSIFRADIPFGNRVCVELLSNDAMIAAGEIAPPR